MLSRSLRLFVGGQNVSVIGKGPSCGPNLDDRAIRNEANRSDAFALDFLDQWERLLGLHRGLGQGRVSWVILMFP